MRIYIDLETYSSVNLKTAGVYRYTASPDFQVLLCGWSAGDEITHVTQGVDARLQRLAAQGHTFVAHNANFDRVALRAGGLDIPIEQWECTSVIAGEHSQPQGLEKLANALGTAPKDLRGAALVRFFCSPNRKGLRNLPEDNPEEWAEFIAYCRQDVVALAEIDRRLGGFPTSTERAIYHADQRINDRGFRIDREMAEAAVVALEDNGLLLELEAMRLTGLQNPNSGPQLTRWLTAQGLDAGDLTKETVDALLSDDLSPVQRRVLEIRQELALVAPKKYPAALAMVGADDRLRGSLRFFGAHTGRWTGKGVQPQNFPRDHFDDDLEEDLAIARLKQGLGASQQDLKKLVRALLVGPFTVVDYSSIEAVVIAWLAGEEWALQAFRDGRDIYVETASRMGGLTRPQGKVAVLALGFGGGIASLKAMWDDRVPLPSDAALTKMVYQWRDANPSIVRLWHTMEGAFRSGGEVGDHLYVEKSGQDRRIRLPSGRATTYRACKWTPSAKGMRASFLAPVFGRTGTYGGRLTENSVQAVARDILGEALVRLEAKGYQVVAHTHDEIIIEGTHPVDEVVAIMCEELAWSAGMPINAAGFQSDRYKKG